MRDSDDDDDSALYQPPSWDKQELRVAKSKFFEFHLLNHHDCKEYFMKKHILIVKLVS